MIRRGRAGLLLLMAAASGAWAAQAPRAETFIQTMKELAGQKNWSELKARAEARCQESPKDPYGWLALGMAEGGLGQPKVSAEALEKAFALGPEIPAAGMNLALAYARSGEAGRLRSLVDRMDRKHYAILLYVLDNDEVFRALAPEWTAVSEDRWVGVQYPKLGPYPGRSLLGAFNKDAFLGGNVLYEAQVAPDGHVTDCRALVGPQGLIGAGESFVRKLKFPPVERGAQRAKVVLYFDHGFDHPDEPQHLKKTRMGIGCTVAEATKRAEEVPETQG